MSESSTTTASLASDIEARQDDLLRQLDVLEKQIARVLSDYAASVKSPARPTTSLGASGILQPAVVAETTGVALPIALVAVPVAAAATAIG